MPFAKWTESLGRALPSPNSRSTVLTNAILVSDACNHLQVLAGYGQRIGSALVEAQHEFDQIAGQIRLTLRVECRERLQHRPVIRAEDFQKMLGRAIAEHEHPPVDRQVRDTSAQELAQPLLGA